MKVQAAVLIGVYLAPEGAGFWRQQEHLASQQRHNWAIPCLQGHLSMVCSKEKDSAPCCHRLSLKSLRTPELYILSYSCTFSSTTTSLLSCFLVITAHWHTQNVAVHFASTFYSPLADLLSTVISSRCLRSWLSFSHTCRIELPMFWFSRPPGHRISMTSALPAKISDHIKMGCLWRSEVSRMFLIVTLLMAWLTPTVWYTAWGQRL